MSQFDLLATRRFLPLFVAQFLGALNDNIFRFALVIFITFTLAERSPLPAGMLVVASGGIFILPFFLFSAFAGQLADKLEKARLIRLIKLAEIAIMALGAIGFWLQHAGFLLGVLFLMGTHSAFFGPLKYGILPQHLHEHELTGGNALIQMATYIAILLGAMIGGFVAGLHGHGALPIVVCVTAVACIGWLAALRIPDAPSSVPELAIDWQLGRATWRLLREAAAERTTLVLTWLISWFWFEGATFLSMVPTFGKETLGANEHAVTLLNAAFTVGIGLGSLACESLSRRQVEIGLSPWAAVGLSAFALDLYLQPAVAAAGGSLTLANFFTTPSAVRVFVDLVGIGACGALYIVPLNAALQASAAIERRSRVIAALNVWNALFMVGSAVFTLILFKLGVTIPQVFALVAALNVVAIAAALCVLPALRGRAVAVWRRAPSP
ncbi:MAG: MFS transporter [Gammaproteobacteria bacterium]